MATGTDAAEAGRYARGTAVLERIHGAHSGAGIVAALAGVCPDLARMTIEWGFGEIASRPGIDLKTRQLVTIASCVTLGHAQPQLRAHIEGALNVGATPEEIVEVILQVSLYAGFAAGTNAMLLAGEVFASAGLLVAESDDRRRAGGALGGSEQGE